MKYQITLVLVIAFGLASCHLAIAEFVRPDISSDQEDLLFSKVSATSNLRSQTYMDNMNSSLIHAPETSSTVTTIDGVDVNTTVASIDGVEVTNTVSSVDGLPLSTTVVSLDGVPVSTTVVSNPKLGATKGSTLRSGGFIIPFEEQSLQKKSLKKTKKTMSSDASEADILALQIDVAILNKEVTKLEGDIKFLNATKANKTNPQPVPAPQSQPVPIAQPQPAPAPQPVSAPQPQPVCIVGNERCDPFLNPNPCCSGLICFCTDPSVDSCRCRPPPPPPTSKPLSQPSKAPSSACSTRTCNAGPCCPGLICKRVRIGGSRCVIP